MLMCRDLAKVASDYIDGQMGTMGRLSVKVHLMMCKDCRSFIGNLRASVQLMQGHSTQKPDEQLIDRIDASIQQALSNSPAKDGDQGKTRDT